MDKTVSFIGAGKMAEAIISGLLSSKKITNAQVIISDKYDKRRIEIEETYNVRSTPDNVVCAKEGAIVFLSVKPKDMAEVLIQCKPILRQSKLIVSIAAGIEIKFIESLLDKETKIIRVMPNIAVTVAEGMSVVMKNTAADATDINIVKELLSSTGDVIEIRDEELFHAVTALSGSGPAYILMFLEALSDAGVRMGLSRDVANRLATQTVIGAGMMAKGSELSFATLKEAVISPAGTTAEALAVLEKMGVRSAIIEAIKAATTRSREIATTHPPDGYPEQTIGQTRG
ncbi:MAG: pyrroline-5-carboxylate reductase [Deltaproteobacteria bacterium]|nr:pyrroline-5-carboxylate reductase [Deltaproteobacteria bacterium]MCL5276541.1 pyrroline-5-carboxylate reductase [Deltaproteobacteria bacterium]